jgi:WD40 repeat protein
MNCRKCAYAIALAALLPSGLFTQPPATPRLDGDGEPLPEFALMRLGSRRFRVGSPSEDWFRLLPGGSILCYHRPQGPFDRLHRMDVATGRTTEVWPLPYDREPRALSPDGRYVLLVKSPYRFTFVDDSNRRVQRDSGGLQLFDLTKRQVVWEQKADPHPYSWQDSKTAVYSSDGQWIGMLLQGHQRVDGVGVWEAATGREVKRRERANSSLLGFADGGKTLVVRDTKDGQVALLDRESLEERRSFPAAKPSAAALAPDGKFVAVATDGPQTRVWEIATGKPVAELVGQKCPVSHFAFAPDGKTVVTAGDDRVARIFDWPSGRARRDINLARRVDWLGITPDGRQLALCYAGEHVLHYFDLETGKSASVPHQGHRGAVYGLAVAADGTLVSVSADTTLRAWDLRTGRTTWQRDTREDSYGLTLSPDGSIVAVIARDHASVRLVNRTTGEVRQTLNTPDSVYWVQFSLDGRFIVGHTESKERVWALRVWNTATGAVDLTLPHTEQYVGQCATFGPNSRRFAAIYHNSGPLRLWDVRTWTERPGLDVRTHANPRDGADFIFDLRISPDERMLVTIVSEGLRVWELASQKPRAEFLTGSAHPRSVRFSRTGHWLAWSDCNLRIHVWDAWQGTKFELRGAPESNADHGDSVPDLAFSADERMLVTAGGDGTILVWDLAGAAAKAGVVGRAAPSAAEVASAWVDLGSGDAKAAFEAVRTLTHAPTEALRRCREGLKPAGPVDAQLVKRWVNDLGDTRFAVRDKASAELLKLGPRAADALEALLAGSPPAEARKRATQLLTAARGQVPGPDRLREIRALELLERIGGNESQRLVESLAAGAADAPLTQDAAEILKR